MNKALLDTNGYSALLNGDENILVSGVRLRFFHQFWPAPANNSGRFERFAMTSIDIY